MNILHKLQIEPLTPCFGAIIEGIDISSGSYISYIETLKDALQKYKLLVIKGKPIHPNRQIGFSRMFGELEKFNYSLGQLKDHHEIFRASNDPKKGRINVGNNWHQDGMYKPHPFCISLFHLARIPTYGGCTLFADGHKVFSMLPPDIQNIAITLKTETHNSIVHDLVITHPFTGQNTILINFKLTPHIFSTGNTNQEQITQVISAINELLENPELQYKHYWKEGDLIIADNYSICHKGTAILDDSIKIMHRTSVKGSYRFNE